MILVGKDIKRNDVELRLSHRHLDDTLNVVGTQHAEVLPNYPSLAVQTDWAIHMQWLLLYQHFEHARIICVGRLGWHDCRLVHCFVEVCRKRCLCTVL
jgi:hypothetical protein